MVISRASGFYRFRLNTAGQNANRRIFVLAVVSIVALLYWPATVDLLRKWHSSVTYSHGFLLAPIAIWFASAVPAGRMPFASKLPISIVFLTIGVGAVWSGGYLANVSIVQMLSLPVLMWCGLSLVFGRRAAPGFVAPIGLLFFGVPIWDYGNFLLQDLTTVVVGVLLDALQRPAVIDGSFVHLRAGTFEIASGCSGLHFFIVALALSSIYGYRNLVTVTDRIRLIALAGILALIANWIRVFSIILAGDLTDMQHFLVSVDHYYFGWIVFIITLVPFFLYGGSLGASEHKERAKESAILCEMPKEALNVARSFRVRRFARASITFVVLAIWPILAYTMNKTSVMQDILPIVAPTEISNWIKIESSPLAGRWSPVFIGAAQEYSGTFSDGLQSVDIYLNLYRSESQGEELVGYENGWYDKNVWRLNLSWRTKINDDKKLGMWRVLNIQRGGRSRVVLASYVIGARIIENETAAKIAGLFNRITGPTLLGAIAVSAKCEPDCDIATQRAQSFIESSLPVLRETLADSTGSADDP